MFVFRLILGLGVGPKSATIPIFASECAPAESRGALVMLWQQFTAFGIMLGYVMGVAFGNVQGGYSCEKGGSHCVGLSEFVRSRHNCPLVYSAGKSALTLIFAP